MSESQKPEKSGGLSTRGAVLAGVGIVLFLILAAWGAVFYAKMRETHAVLWEVAPWRQLQAFPTTLTPPEEMVEHLGGPETAASRLTRYARLPRWIAPYRADAACLLGYCARPLRWLENDPWFPSIWPSVLKPGDVRPVATKIVPVLAKLLSDSDVFVRASAAEALGHIGPAAEDAAPALEKALKDEDEGVREAAAEALKKIRREAPEEPEEPSQP